MQIVKEVFLPLFTELKDCLYIANLALEKLVVGRMVADVIACIGSLDIVLGEIDR